jgi:hypothetical protein
MWKDIAGFETRYKVDEFGNILNCNKLTLLSPSKDRDGYYQIGIRHKGIRKKVWFKIHKLVAIAFLNSPENIETTQVDHIDRNKENNSHLNLRWVTPRENCNNRKQTAWKTNKTSGELYVTKYKNGWMLRINNSKLHHRSWHKTLESAVEQRAVLLS